MFKVLFFSSYCIISLLLLWIAPLYYSHSFCQALMYIHLCYVLPFLYLKIKYWGFFNFDVLFLFSYFCINYLHSVFIYPNDEFLPAFAFKYNNRVISYALSLASLGISFYMLGNVIVDRKLKRNIIINYRTNLSVIRTVENVALICTMILFVYVILSSIGKFQHLYPRLMFLLVALITLAFFYKASYVSHVFREKNGFILFYDENKKNIFSLILFSISLLMIGSRSNVIILFLSVCTVINLYYVKLKMKYVLPIGGVGIFVMSILMLTRDGAYMIGRVPLKQTLEFGIKMISESDNVLWLPLLDFIVNARTLYESIDYVIVNGCMYGVSYVKTLFCFIPGGASFFVSDILGKDLSDFETGYRFTEFANAPYGIGTNMIADLYANFYIIGVIIGTFLLGMLVANSRQKYSKYKLLLYISLVGNAIYLPRAYIFIWLDLFVFFVLLDLAFMSIPKIKKSF